MRTSNLHSWILSLLASAPLAQAIVGGSEAAAGDFSFAVSIERQGSTKAYHACTGNIVGSTSILTAASCCDDYQAADFGIRYGSKNRTSGGATVAVSEVIVHPQWNSGAIEYDFCILKLADAIDPLVGPSNPASLPSAEPAISKRDFRVAGWGRTQPGGNASTVLMEAPMVGVVRSTCASYWGRTMYKSNLCVTHRSQDSNPTTSACQGDGGGPMVDQKGLTLLGISSYGSPDCATKSRPNVFANVFIVKSWIVQNSK